jgi:hypothetical protein
VNFLNILQSSSRATLSSNVKKLSAAINNSADATTLDDLEHYRGRLQETARANDSKLSMSESSINLASTPLPQCVPAIAPTITLPTIKLEPFTGDNESWQRFWEKFQSSVDTNPSVSQINKYVYLRGYLNREPKHLVDGIAVTAETYEETKRILHAKYGDKNRKMQVHLDYLEDIKPMRSATPELLNTAYVECNRRLQALRALGENVDNYGRILAPKILRGFPEDICRRWIIHIKREQISDGDITNLMAFLNDKVEGAIITEKIRGDMFDIDPLTPTTASFHVSSKPNMPSTPKSKRRQEPFCVFCDSRGHWAQDFKQFTDVKDRAEKLKKGALFPLFESRYSYKNCGKRGKIHSSKCRPPHHYSICDADHLVATSVHQIEAASSNFTHLQTARIWIIGPTGLRKLTRYLLDAGSQSSFVSTSLVDHLQLRVLDRRDVIISPFESSTPTPHSRRLVRFTVQGMWADTNVSITAFDSSHTYVVQPKSSRNLNAARKPLVVQLWASRYREMYPL